MARRPRDWHLPTFARLRRRGHEPGPFGGKRAWPWLILGGGILVAMAILTAVWPGGGDLIERVATLLSLYFFVVTFGSWAGLGSRSLWVAAFAVALLYGLSAATRIVDVHDLFVVSLIVGLLLFVLAGFSLLFVLEEVIYDAHRLIGARSAWWGVVPVATAVGLAIAVPILDAAFGWRPGAVWVVAIAATALLALVWVVRGVTGAGPALTREADLLVAGALAGAALADAVGLMQGTTGFLPSIIAYAALIGTWIYVSLTTLQRAQYFLRGRDVVPWIALLLSSGFAVLAHVHSLYRSTGGAVFPDLVNVRVGYLRIGVWLGLGFFVLRGLWRILLYVRDDSHIATPARRVAGSLARVTEEVLVSERRVERAAVKAFGAFEKMVPGQPRGTRAPALVPLDAREGAAIVWQRDAAGGERPVLVIDDSEE